MTSGFLGGNNFTFFSNGGPTIPTGIITGNVSSPYVPYADGANTLANSGLYWAALNTRLGINNTSPAQSLDVTGSVKYSVGLYTPLTTGSVPFIGASGLVSEDNSNFFWDDTNKRLGIGTATPTFKIDVHGTGIALGINGTTTNNAYAVFQNAGSSKWRIGNTYSAAANYFSIYDSVNSLDRLTILNSGFVGIGTATPSVLLHLNSASTPAFRLVDTTEGANKVLISDANGNATWAALSSIFGSGTTNYVPRFTAATTIGNSTMQDNGSNLGVATAPNASYTMDVGGTVRIQQSVTMVASGAYYVGIGIAPSSNGRLNVYANSITGIYITGNSLSQKGIDLNGTILVFATAAGSSAQIQGDAGSGNLNVKGLNTVNWFPDIITSASTAASVSLISNGAGGYKTSLSNIGKLLVDGNIYAGQSPFTGGSGWIFTVDPATGSQNTNGWALGNVTTGTVSLDTTRYVRIDIGGTTIKFLIAP